ncbi:MAG: sigma-54 dependent transcriptional regulator, partial [bacterium]
REPIHLALVDLTMPDLSGLEVLRAVKERQPDARVMIMTAYATAESAVEAMKQGALDYLIKPFALDELKLQIRRALGEAALVEENESLRRALELRNADRPLVGRSPALLAALDLVRRVAGQDTTILVTGETGTGKELIARALHGASTRNTGPFLAINCGAIPESLLERELFGNERGAFTGADAARAGLLEAAAAGSLFLDEIADLPVPLQPKLLRVLEGHDFLRVGGTRPVRCRTRFIAATNRDLAREVRDGRFRQDLFYRLNGLVVPLPPLRERGEDIPLLAAHFLERFARQAGRAPLEFSAEAAADLARHAWPGNVRELRNAVERAVLVNRGGVIEPGDLALAGSPAAAGEESALLGLPFAGARDAFERRYLEHVLNECGGNITQAAERMGLDRKNL